MIDYEIIEEDLEDYNFSARKIRFKKPLPETPEHGIVKEAVLVDQIGGIGMKTALFIEDELFIESLYDKALFWRLAELSENYKISVENV